MRVPFRTSFPGRGQAWSAGAIGTSPCTGGGVSDPFQPAERLHRASLQCLDVFADTGYPFVFSTKGALVVEPEYLARIRASRCVAQVSMVCSRYDQMETGAPTYEERLAMCEKLAKNALRVIARAQPYMPEVRDEILKNLPRLRNAGVYGIVFEGMKFADKRMGVVRVGTDYCYPREVLERDFRILRQACHENGLRFFAGENRLRTMGDSMCCCGIEGLEGFKGNDFNIVHLKAGEPVVPTEKMKERGTGGCFKTIGINTANTRRAAMNSFFQEMMRRLKLGNVGV